MRWQKCTLDELSPSQEGDSSLSVQCCRAQLLHGGRKLLGELLHSSANLVTDAAYSLEVLPGWVIELPVFVVHAREVWALIATAHRDNNADGAHLFRVKDARLPASHVDAELAHRLHRHWVERVCGSTARRTHLDAVTREMLHEARRHLRAASIVNAEEQDGGALRHVLSVRPHAGLRLERHGSPHRREGAWEDDHMFTGIVQETGVVESLEQREDGSARIVIDAGELTSNLPEGGSLAVNGACLTLALGATTGTSSFEADLMGETLARTTLGELKRGDRVNLERCLAPNSLLDGHIVQGHVDGVGEVLHFAPEGGTTRLRVSVPSELAPLCAVKGSITLDGVSLTVTAVSSADAGEHWLEVGLIPSTINATRFSTLRVGDRVNIEVDVLARYAARLAEFRQS